MKRRGFTLLEAMVALSIIAIVSLGALQAFAAESRAATRARALTTAVAVASERLARLQLLDGSQLRALPDSLARGVAHSYEWAASARPVPNEPGLFSLQVRVAWASGAYQLDSRVFRANAAGAP